MPKLNIDGTAVYITFYLGNFTVINRVADIMFVK